MNIVFEPVNNIRFIEKPVGIGLGNFDGVHLGHSELVRTLKSECLNRNLEAIIYTFNKHPENIIRKKFNTPQIMSNKKKIEILNKFEIDYLFFGKFDERFSRLSPKDFIKKILVDYFGVKLVVVGHDYRFGFRGNGDVQLLKQLGSKYNFDVIVLDAVLLNSQIVSSTAIRCFLTHGEVLKANDFLGRPFSIEGVVVKGRAMGHKIGFPTANLIPEKYLVKPANGVYLTKTRVNDKIFKSITNVGLNPTFNLTSVSIETHIINFDQDIYGKIIDVEFFERLRGEKKFNSIDQLIAQIKFDVNVCINTEY